MLKNKKVLNYRRGYAWAHCSQCNYYVAKFEVRSCASGEVIAIQPRCRLIGLEHSRNYRIKPNYICDKYDNSEALKRLGVK